MNFETYKVDFEAAIVGGVADGLLGKIKSVPVHHGKLHKRRIAQVMGDEMDTDLLIAIDYYGYMKRSRGFKNYVKEVMEKYKGSQVKLASATVVHFNSVRLEILAKIATNLVADFGDFKKAVLDAREFNHNYNI